MTDDGDHRAPVTVTDDASNPMVTLIAMRPRRHGLMAGYPHPEQPREVHS
jgi:hypothetical protein